MDGIREDQIRNRELNAYLDKAYGEDFRRDARIEERANDKFHALPCFYKSMDGKERYTNFEDALNDLKTADFVSLGQAIRDGKHEEAGRILADVMMRICEEQAENEIDDEEVEIEEREYEREAA